MKTKIILDIKWLQEKRKTRPGKMITRHSANSLQERFEDTTRVIRSRRKTDNKIAKRKRTKGPK
jgi:hypothetical protein